MKAYNLLIALLFVYLFIVPSTNAQTVEEYEMHQLKAISNLSKFGVYIWDFEGDKWNNNLTVSKVEEFVKKALKEAGIKTIDFSEARGLKGAPNLEISVKVDEKANSGVYSYSVILRFIQDANLLRNNVVNYGAITWERDDVSFAAEKDLDLELKISINSLLDEFISDYKKVN